MVLLIALLIAFIILENLILLIFAIFNYLDEDNKPIEIIYRGQDYRYFNIRSTEFEDFQFKEFYDSLYNNGLLKDVKSQGNKNSKD